MKNKILVSLFLLLSIVIITGCEKEKTNTTKEKKTITCTETVEYEEGVNAGETELREHVVTLDSNNKILKYTEKRTISFDEEDKYNDECDSLKEEYAESSSNKYDYYNYDIKCNSNKKQIVTKDNYDITVIEEVDDVPISKIRKRLNVDFIFNINGYIENEEKNGYTCS